MGRRARNPSASRFEKPGFRVGIPRVGSPHLPRDHPAPKPPFEPTTDLTSIRLPDEAMSTAAVFELFKLGAGLNNECLRCFVEKISQLT